MTSLWWVLSIVVLGLAVKPFWPRRMTVVEYERAVTFKNGRLGPLLLPGAHWFLPFFTEVRRFDVRPRLLALGGQEVLSADGVPLKVTVVAKYQIEDPAKVVNAAENLEATLHLELQLALRQVLGSAPIEDVLGKRGELGNRLYEIAAPRASELGVKLLEAGIRDLVFPGEVKKIFTQVARARHEGLAALERARGEIAAMRSLANAAHLVERNPALLQLRILQVLGQQAGNTVVLNMAGSAGSVPLPKRADEAGTAEAPEGPGHD
jgi:regulator of protease activity HflC (stomatin/prohibitin superfamily)